MAKKQPQGVVPSNRGGFDLEMLPAQPGSSENMDGSYDGVVIICHKDSHQFLMGKFEVWFDEETRPEVSLVGEGTSEKLEQGYIILEWQYCQIDPLFLAILNEEAVVLDYLLYIRDEEE